MKNVDADFIFQPVRFILSEDFLSGCDGEKVPDFVEIIKEKKSALEISISQNLPQGFKVWQDSIDNAVSEFRMEKGFHEGEVFLESADSDFESYQKKISLSYRKAKIKKNNTEYDDFYFNVLGESYYQLKMVSLQRYVKGYIEDSFLERLFFCYSAGLYPCGIKNNKKISAYNPCSLIVSGV